MQDNQPQNQQPQQAPVQAMPPQPDQVQMPSPPKKSGFGKVILFGIIGLVLMAMLGVFIYLLINRSQGVGGGSGERKIVWWGFWEEEAVVLPLIAAFEEENPGVKVEYVYQSQEEYRVRLANALAQGRGPDIMRLHNTWVPMFRNNLSSLPPEIMSFDEYSQTFYPVAIQSLSTKDGEILGLPLEYDALGLFVNQEIFDTYNATVPETWAEMREVARRLTIRNRESVTQAGAALGSTQNVDHWEEILALLMVQNRANMLEPLGDNASDAIKYYLQFYQEDEVWDEALPSSTKAFINKQVAMYIAPAWRAQEIADANPNLRFRVYPVPQVPKYLQEEPDVTYATFYFEGVNSQSEVQEDAWKFLKFLSTQENLNKLHANLEKSRRDYPAPFPRQDMRQLQIADPEVSGIVALGPDAVSSFMASHTQDGQNGINTQLSQVYRNFMATNVRSIDSDLPMAILGRAVRTVHSQYGLIAPPPPEEE